MDSMFNTSNSRSPELDKLVYSIQRQVLQHNLFLNTLVTLLIQRGVFSDDEFCKEFESVKESCPNIVDSMNRSADNIRVIDILESNQKLTEEDKEFLKQYCEKYGPKRRSLDSIIEQHDSIVDLNDGWSKIFGSNFDSMLQ